MTQHFRGPATLLRTQDTIISRRIRAAIRKQKEGIEAPLLKFCYLGKIGAVRYAELLKSNSYSTAIREINLINRSSAELKRLPSPRRPTSLIAIGSGTGEKAARILQILSPVSSLCFTGLDISKEMLAATEKLFGKLGISLTSQSYRTCDFDDRESFLAISREIVFSSKYANHLFISTGNTLANIPDHFGFLAFLANAMDIPVRFLVSLELKPDDDNGLIEEYAGKEDLEFLSTPLNLLGLCVKDFDITITFNDAKQRIEASCTYRRRIELDSGLVLHPGEKTLIGFSYKFNQDQVSEAIQAAGLSLQLKILDNEASQGVFIMSNRH